MRDLFLSGDSEGFTPEEYEDIVLCLFTLFSIRAGEVPLDRDLGVDYDKIVSYPAPVAKNMLSLEIIDKAERYEPRISVDSVEFEDREDGRLIPRIHFVKRRGA